MIRPRGSSQTVGQQLGSLQGTNLGALHVVDSQRGSLVCLQSSETRTSPWQMSQIFGTYFLPQEALISLNIVASSLVLPRLDTPCIADSPWEVLSFLKRGWGWQKRGVVREWEETREGKRWLACKISKKINKKILKIDAQ